MPMHLNGFTFTFTGEVSPGDMILVTSYDLSEEAANKVTVLVRNSPNNYWNGGLSFGSTSVKAVTNGNITTVTSQEVAFDPIATYIRNPFAGGGN